MAKQFWKPATLLNPVPVVMVSCADGEKRNILTIAWAGTINSDPPMVSISVRKERYSYEIIKNSKQFVINMPSKELTKATDYCGVKSGANVDKFSDMKLTPVKGQKIECPMIAECPVNIECIVKNEIDLGSHVMFMAEVVGVNVDEKLLDEKGKLDLEKANLICYCHGKYYSLDKSLGFFGYSIAKKKDIKR